jgi:hypothetical protein
VPAVAEVDGSQVVAQPLHVTDRKSMVRVGLSTNSLY